MSRQPGSPSLYPPLGPQPPRFDKRGLAAGITSIVTAILAPMAALLSVPLGFLSLAAQITRYADRNEGWWVGALVLLVLAAALVLTAVISGLFAVFRSRRVNAGRVTGFIGLGIVALTAFGMLFSAMMVAGSIQGG